MEDLARELGRDARRIIPMEVGLGQVLARSDSKDADPLTTTVVAAPPELFSMIRVGMLAGRAYTPDGKTAGGDDVIEVVLDEALAREIRPDDPGSLVGTEVGARRPGQVFQGRIVGVLRDPITLRKHMKVFDTSSSARIVTGRRLEFRNLYVPYVEGQDAVSLLLIQVADLEGLSPGEERIRDFFSTREEEPFVFAQKTWIDAIGVYVNRFSFLAHFFWILNLGVVLVLSSAIAGLAIEERFRELAIRRVEGATLGQVLLPILGEGGVLAGLAIPVGWGLSEWILADYVVPTLGWPPVVPGHFWIWLPLLLVGVGLATYGVPGRRVARRAPVSVLARHG
jgi:ABC-type antimicrobial peptide transport system permease subunit